MTYWSLRRQLIFVGLSVLAIIFASALETICWSKTETFISKHSTLIALLFAAYLAFVFQQRGKFVDDLRRWWNEIVAAKSAFFIYCDKIKPTEDDYFEGYYKLSTAMDTLRLIYCNVNRTKQNPKGFYPFEQVRDIIDVAKSIRPSVRPTKADRLRAKLAIELIFQSLRHAIQDEAKASTPDKPSLFESEFRSQYLSEIKKGIGLDVMKIRYQNHKLDYVSKRESLTP